MTIGFRQNELGRACEILRRGGLVAFPTETVYGLGADAASADALHRLFSAKGRPSSHPVIVHLAHAREMDRWGREIPPVAWELAARFWPGPLTFILKRSPTVLDAVTGGQDTVGVRVPGHPTALALLEAFGGGIAAPSANRFGRLSPTAASHVVAELGSAVDCVLDGGPCSVGIESTILDLSAPVPRVLRPGGIGFEDLAEILGELPRAKGEGIPRVPGAMHSHYAPRTPLFLVPTETVELGLGHLHSKGKRVEVLSQCRPADLSGVRWSPMPAEPEQYARVLYDRLRAADLSGSDFIVVEQPPTATAWDAVCDRLLRAACRTGKKEI